MFVDVNGEIFEEAEAKVSVFDSGYYFGLGIYETLLIKDGVPVFYDEHMVRLGKALHFLEFPEITALQQGLPDRIKALLQKNLEAGKLYRMRINVTPGRIRLAEFKFEGLTSVIIMAEVTTVTKEAYSMHISRLPKNTGYALPSYVKLTSNHKNLVSARDARVQGADEALLINEQGYLTEGSFSNFFFVKGNTVFTAAEGNNLLSGITREKILQIAQLRGLPLQVGNYSVEDLKSADEAFLSSSTRGVARVNRILYNQNIAHLLKVTTPEVDPEIETMGFEKNEITAMYARYYRETVEENVAANRERWL